MSSAGEEELYELLLRLDALEELLEELEERDLETLEELDAVLATEPDTEDLRSYLHELLQRGIRTAAEVRRELAELEQRIEEPGAAESEWLGPN
ncbi:MAG: hypothetical protein RMK01_10225 [Thermomicrobium sp.]|nr:hypothetical protein [Thermomicrobium sp.]MDW8060439.1 hypothetical protein [Thermomicrobium sp.]